MKKDGLLSVRQPVVEVVNVRKNVRVCKRGSFGGAGRSACVQKHENRVRIVKLSGVWFFVGLTKRSEVDHVLPLQGHRGCGKLRMPDQTARSRILKNPVNLGACITRVDGNCNDAKQAAGIDQFDVVRPIRHQEGQSISTQKTATPKRRGGPSHSDIQLQQRYSPLIPQQSCMLREVLQGATNGMGINHRSLLLGSGQTWLTK